MLPYFRAYTLRMHITHTRLYPAQNRIFSKQKFVQPAQSYTPHCSCEKCITPSAPALRETEICHAMGLLQMA